MTTIAAKLNDWLTPTARKYLHTIVALAAGVALIWGVSTGLVNEYVALAVAVGGLLSAILSAIVTKRADMAALYAAAAAADAALVALRFLDPVVASKIDQTLYLFVAAAATFAFTRTNTTTVTGAPVAEIPAAITPTILFSPAPVADPSIDIVAAAAAHAASVALSTTASADGPADGTPPTTTLS